MSAEITDSNRKHSAVHLLDFNLQNLSNELSELLLENDHARQFEAVAVDANEYQPIEIFHDDLNEWGRIRKLQQQQPSSGLSFEESVARTSTYIVSKPSAVLLPIDAFKEKNQQNSKNMIKKRGKNSLNSAQNTLQKYGLQPKMQKARQMPLPNVINYDNVVVDLSSIGLSIQNLESNDVLRIFNLLRRIYHYMNDSLPLKTDDEDGGVVDLLQCNRSMAVLPRMAASMNLIVQLKQFERKCIMFTADMSRVLNDNKVLNAEKYTECEASLERLKNLLATLGNYKSGRFEHSQGKFITFMGMVKSKELENILELICDQIRECHLFVHVFNWSNVKWNKLSMLSTAITKVLQNEPMPASSAAVFESSGAHCTNLAAAPIAYGDNNGGNNGGPGDVRNGSSHVSHRNQRRLPLRYIG